MKCLWVCLCFISTLAAPQIYDVAKTLGFIKRNFGIDLRVRGRRTAPDYYNSDGCRGGRIRNINGACEEPIVERRVYIYSLPEIEQRRDRRPKALIGKPRVDYNVVLIQPGRLAHTNPPYVSGHGEVQNLASGVTDIPENFAYDYEPAVLDYVDFEDIGPFYGPEIFFKQAPVINAHSRIQNPGRISSQRNNYQTGSKYQSRDRLRTPGFGINNLPSLNSLSGRREISNFGSQLRRNKQNENSRALKQKAQFQSGVGGLIIEGTQFLDNGRFQEHATQQNTLGANVDPINGLEQPLDVRQQLTGSGQGISQSASVSGIEAEKSTVNGNNIDASQSTVDQSAIIDQNNILNSQIASQDVKINVESQQLSSNPTGQSGSSQNKAGGQTIISSQFDTAKVSSKRIPGRVDPHGSSAQVASSQIASTSGQSNIESEINQAAKLASDTSTSSVFGGSNVQVAGVQPNADIETPSRSSISSNAGAISTQQTQQQQFQTVSQQATLSASNLAQLETLTEQSDQALVFITTMEGLRSLTANEGAAQVLIQSGAGSLGSVSLQGSLPSQNTLGDISSQITLDSANSASTGSRTSNQEEQFAQVSTLSKGSSQSSSTSSGPELSITITNASQGKEHLQVRSGTSIKDQNSVKFDEHASKTTASGKSFESEIEQQRSSQSTSLSSASGVSESRSSSSSSSAPSDTLRSKHSEQGNNSFIRINFSSSKNIPPVNVKFDSTHQ